MHKSLYRKYRPQAFFDVVGQEHITATLKNEIMSGKTAHAYLFTGTRGTGKTTCAKIFAKAVNCLNPVNGNPCNQCEICNAISENEVMDIVEIDAASNNSVDDIRELREDVIYSPSVSKYKIYIIDEVHMLSNSAFNALLKTLEEPPAHVIFILATTEVNKVPMTVLSRCQRFDFRRLTVNEIFEHLVKICKSEKIEFENDAISLVARLGDGSVRDALSVLDQCVGAGEKLTLDLVEKMTQSTGREVFFEISKSVSEKDFSEALSIISRLYYTSKDLQKINEDMISFFRDVMIIKEVGIKEGLVVCSETDAKKFNEIAAKFTTLEIINIIETLQASLEKMPRTVNKRVLLEMTFLKLCAAKSGVAAVKTEEVDFSSVSEKKKTVEPKPEPVKTEPEATSAPVKEEAPLPDAPPWEPDEFFEQPKKEEAKPIIPEPKKEIPKETVKPSANGGFDKWNEILNELKANGKMGLWAMLLGSTAEKSGNSLIVKAPNLAAADILKLPTTVSDLAAAAKAVTGESYIIETADKKAKTEKSGDLFDNWLENNINDIDLT